MKSKDKNQSSSRGNKSASLSMNPSGTNKRQKLDGTDNSKVETVELDMTQDAVPLEVNELTHNFMADISSLEDTQLTECVPRRLCSFSRNLGKQRIKDCQSAQRN